jgi:hypothetical protein
VEDTSEQPDIYYIVLDGYARDDILLDIFEYDNSYFVNFLEEKGFYVARKSNSNYAHTFLSLASTLNMQYLDFLSSDPGKKSNDPTIPHKMIEKNKLVDILRQNGYLIINTHSIWSHTGKQFDSDMRTYGSRNFQLFGKTIVIDEFNLVFLQTTLLTPFIKSALADEIRDHTLNTFEELGKIPKMKEKKFVLAHINLPHPPYVFGKGGEKILNPDLDLYGDAHEDRESYLSQLEYITFKTQEVLTNILNNSKRDLIIVIQSDHGPMSILGNSRRWEDPPQTEGIKERMAILNAYYFPDKKYDALYENITPVNSFRLILQQYLGENTEFLGDKSYFSNFISEIYDFKDVTDEIN